MTQSEKIKLLLHKDLEDSTKLQNHFEQISFKELLFRTIINLWFKLGSDKNCCRQGKRLV